MKDSGVIDNSWDEIADIINKEIGNDDMPFSEAAFRKPYQQAKRFYNAGVFGDEAESGREEELRELLHELEKERVKTRDERNELKRILREEARKESYREQILRTIKEYSGKPLEYDKNKKFDGVVDGDNDMIISMTDIHAGIEVSNFCNTFNQDVLKDRFNHYLDRIIEIQKRHGSKDACVIMSELCSGIIHTGLRIENNQNLIEQFLTVINYTAEFLEELSYNFNTVHVFICPGNHSRIMANKEEHLKGENIDHLALPFLEAKLQNFDNVLCHYNEIEESIAIFNVRGNVVMASHGDKDSPEKVVQKFTLLFGLRPNIVMLGHRHTNALTTVYDCKVIQSGSLSGADNFCMDKRLRNKPEQTVTIVKDYGADCIYDIKF